MRRPSMASSRAGCVRPRSADGAALRRMADQAVDDRTRLPGHGQNLKDARDTPGSP